MSPLPFMLVTITLLTIAPEISAAPRYNSRIPPPSGAGPVVVSVQFQVLDFARVNSRDESFDVTGYLELSWTDPQLALRGNPPTRTVRYVNASDIWIPRVYFANALEQPRDHGEPDVEVDSEGRVFLREIISGKFSAELSLHTFPFDRQLLPLRIGAHRDRTRVMLQSDRDRVALSPQAFLTDWNILGIGVRPTEERYAPDSDLYSFVVIETVVARKWTFYLWRVLFPMTLLVIVSWTVLWMDPVIVAP